MLPASSVTFLYLTGVRIYASINTGRKYKINSMLLNITIYHISLSKIPIIIHLSQFIKHS